MTAFFFINLKFNLIFLLFFYMLVYLYEIFDLNVSSQNSLNLSSYVTTPNFFLTNSINKYHPYLFYISIILIILFSVSVLIAPLQKLQLWLISANNYNLYTQYTQSSALSYVALYLGSWWAFQEGTWGGWWNWDASETFGLFSCLIVVYWIHTTQFNQFCKIIYSTKFFILHILILYFLLQLGFDLLSHNFGLKFFYFFDLNFFILETIGSLIIVDFYLIMRYASIFRCNYILHNYNHFFSIFFWVNNFIFITLGLFLLIVSFSPLLSRFSWFYVNLNVLNEFNNYSLITLVSFILIYIFIRFNICFKLILNCFFIWIIVSDMIILLIILKVKYNIFYNAHLYIIIFVFLNIQSCNSQLMFNNIKSSFVLLNLLLIPLWVQNISLGTDQLCYNISLNVVATDAQNFLHPYFLLPTTSSGFLGFLLDFYSAQLTMFICEAMFYFFSFVENQSMSLIILCSCFGIVHFFYSEFFRVTTFLF